MKITIKESDIARFYSKVNKSGPIQPHVPELGACWVWIAGSRDKYGSFWIGDSSIGAHRVSFAIHHRLDELPPVVMHKCDYPKCVNPSHLQAGTNAENVLDCAKKGRNARGEKSGRYTKPECTARGDRHGRRTNPERTAIGEASGVSRFTNSDIIFIRKSVAEKTAKQADLARQFKTTRAHLNRIVKRLVWTHI